MNKCKWIKIDNRYSDENWYKPNCKQPDVHTITLSILQYARIDFCPYCGKTIDNASEKSSDYVIVNYNIALREERRIK